MTDLELARSRLEVGGLADVCFGPEGVEGIFPAPSALWSFRHHCAFGTAQRGAPWGQQNVKPSFSPKRRRRRNKPKNPGTKPQNRLGCGSPPGTTTS